MAKQRVTVSLAANLHRGLKTSSRRRGATITRTLNAALLHYLRLCPKDKLATMIALHDWELEQRIRKQWKAFSSHSQDTGNISRIP